MKKGTDDIILSLVLMLLGAFAFFESAGFPNIAAHFPRRIALLLILLSCALFLVGLHTRKKNPKAAETDERGTAPSYRNVLLLAGIIAVYILVLDKIGYLVSTIGLALAAIYALGYRNRSKAILAAFCSALVAFVVFRFLLGVPLPLGAFMDG
jgi:predicted membrane protein